MAEKLTIARPYAKAVFEQALAGRSLQDWEQILQVLTAVAQDKHMSGLLDNPLIEDQQLLSLFAETTKKMLPKLSAERQKELENFLTTVIAEKRLTVLPEILHRYERLMAAEQDLKEVTVTSAFPLSEERRQSMIAALTKYLHSKVAVDFHEDAGLIGGAIIRTGNWVMDGSIKGKLQNLRDNLQK